MDDREGGGQRCLEFVMVGDDDINAGLLEQGHFFDAGDAIVDGDHEIGASIDQFFHGAHAEAIAVGEAVGKIVGYIGTEFT